MIARCRSYSKFKLGTALAGALSCLVLGLAPLAAQAWTYKEAAEPYQGTTIHILDERTPLQEVFEKLIPEFEEETGIKVKYELLNHFEVINKGQADMLSGRGQYDAIMNHDFQMGLLLDAKVLRPIDDMLSNENLTNPDLDLGDMIEPIFSSLAKHNGQTYGFLNWNYNEILWARKDLLENEVEKAAFSAKYGYELGVPQTLDNVRDVAEFFTRKAGEELAGDPLENDFYGIVMEGLNGGTTYLTVWFMFVKNSGGHFFTADGKPDFNNPGAIEGIRRWAELWKFSPPGQAEYSLIDVPTVMGSGIAAQALAWSDFVVGVDQPGKSDLAGKFSYGGTPRGADGVPYSSAGAAGAFNISIHSENPEATYLFLQWTIERATQEKLLTLGGSGVPVRNSSWNNAALKDNRLSGLYQAMNASLDGVYATPKMPKFSQLSDMINRMAQQVGIGEMTAEEAVAKMQEAALKICISCLAE